MGKLKVFLDNLTPEQLIERLKLALEGSGLGIWDWDLTDDSVQFDRRWCEMLGLDHATTPMTYETWRARVHPDDLPRAEADIQAHLEGRTARYENVHRMRHADGRWIYILDRGRLSGWDEQGKPVRFTGTHADVTATEEARQVLAQQERQLQQLIANLPQGVAMVDLERRYVAASHSWLEARGLERERLTSRRLGDTERGPEPLWDQPLREAFAGEASHGEETYEPGPDGRGRWVRWDVRPWRRLDGTVAGALISEEDVTEQVARRENVEREQAGRLAGLTFFAGGVAHEINTPLQLILAEAELARLLLAEQPLNVGELRSSMETIAATAVRVASITRALRTLSRDARRDPPTAVSVESTLADTRSLCLTRFASQGVSLELDDRAPGALAMGRASEVLHVLLNLVNNALDAVRGREAPWVRLEAEVAGEQVVVRCVDSGPGVAPEHRGQLMTPFFTTRGDGTGLGLSVSRALAQRDGGSLRCLPGLPSTFELRLPLAKGEVGGA